MSEFSDIEAAVVAALAALTEGGADLFATVSGSGYAERKARVAALARGRTPAALVTVDGRFDSVDFFTPGAVRVIVTLAVRSLRSADGARLGDVDTVGVFTAAQQATTALTGLVIGTRQLVADAERIADADERRVIIEQIWRAEVML